MTTPPTSGLLVIFGITGDLARRYLLPALYHLVGDNLLPEGFEIIGLTRRGTSVDKLLDGIQAELTRKGESSDAKTLEHLGKMIRVVIMDMTDPAGFRALKSTLDSIEDQHRVCLNRLFYLSIPPQVFGDVVDFLAESGLGNGCQHGIAQSRLMVEKPFGHDRTSAEALIERLKRHFTEEQIYRIDHYLAKETAQNILTFRFSNPIFQAVWSHQSVDRIVVTAAESIGIEGRAAFYEPIGALRDLIQSHLLQLLALVTMEQPATMTAAGIHAEKLKLLQAIPAVSPSEAPDLTVRGQYHGYRDEVANQGSITETFARIGLTINNDRWRGVPITLQTGKRLNRKTTQITVSFGDHTGQGSLENTLVFRLQPDEGIAIDLLAKKPGFNQETERVEMTFDYHHSFGEGTHPDAYERVLMDGIRGDQTLFATSAEVLESWRIVDTVVHEWTKSADDLIDYKPGVTPEAIQRPKANPKRQANP